MHNVSGAVVALHILDGFAGADGQRQDVDFEHLAPCLGGAGDKRLGAPEAGIVHQDVEAVAVVFDALEEFLYGCRIP